MPSTLESFVNTYCKKKGLFSKCMGNKLSSLTNVWLNRVQVLGHHDSLNIDSGFLNTKYLEGYKINYNYSSPVCNWGIIPNQVTLTNESKTIELYNEPCD